MDIAPGITVNGIKISPSVIDGEVQYHPSDNYFDAKYNAMRALVIKELLLQEAEIKGFCKADEARKNPDEAIEELLLQELNITDPTDDECLNYYNEHSNRFMTSPLFEVSHILYLAHPDDADELESARERAEIALKRIKGNPASFSQVAKNESACSSSSEGGHIGQISKGQTLPMFEAALMGMVEGGISDTPVLSEVGYHIIKVHKYAEGNPLPYEAVSQLVIDFLKNRSWKAALNDYIEILNSKSDISGFSLKPDKKAA